MTSYEFAMKMIEKFVGITVCILREGEGSE